MIVLALRDQLRAIIDDAVESCSKNGFKVLEHDECKKLTRPGINGKSSPKQPKKIGNLSKKELLANEIDSLECLPEQERLLVVVTGVCTKNDLKKAEVWRGLSSLINSENEEWEVVEESVNQQVWTMQAIDTKEIIQTFIRVALVIYLTGNILLLFQEQNQQTKNQNVIKENEELEFKNENYIKENQELEFKNENLNNEIEIQLKDKRTQLEDLQKQKSNLEIQVHDLESQVHHLQEQVQALESRGMAFQNQTTRGSAS